MGILLEPGCIVNLKKKKEHKMSITVSRRKRIIKNGFFSTSIEEKPIFYNNSLKRLIYTLFFNML
jgi:hypothetical protein